MMMTDRAFISAWTLSLMGWCLIAATALMLFITAPVIAVSPTAQVAVSDVWARATPKGAKVGAVYLTLKSPVDDVLASASTPVAGRTEIHQTSMDVNGAMQMRALAAGIDLPADKGVTLAPSGTHIMLMELKTPLTEGYEIPLTLTFKDTGVQNIRVKIKPVSYMPGIDRHDAHHGHGQHHH